MKENLRERAELRTLPKDLSIFLEPYREQPANQPPVEAQANQSHLPHLRIKKEPQNTTGMQGLWKIRLQKSLYSCMQQLPGKSR